MFSLNGFSGAAAWTLSMLRLVRSPITESPSSTYPGVHFATAEMLAQSMRPQPFR
jgi:hypothetical protein